MNLAPILILGAVALLSAKKGSSSPKEAKKRRISSKFGYRTHPVTGKRSFHNGIDIPLAANTKLFAPANSIVTKAFYNKIGGYQLIYRLSNGVTIGYAHLNKIMVKTGDKLKKNQLIALSGNTGTSTGPHLHVTMRDRKGQLIDPEPYFKLKTA